MWAILDDHKAIAAYGQPWSCKYELVDAMIAIYSE